MKFEPHPYQDNALDFIDYREGRALLALRMGLGKTVITGTAVGRWIDDLTARRVLIIAPPRPKRYVWPAEFEKWDHLRDWGPPLLLEGEPVLSRTTRNTETGMPREIYVPSWFQSLRTSKRAIHVASYDQLPTRLVFQTKRRLERVYLGLVDLLGGAWPYDTLVLDEVHNIKKPGTKRFRALRRVVTKAERVLALTGTPVPNNLEDIWAPIYCVDGGKRLGGTFAAFKDRWFRPAFSGWGIEPLPHARAEIEARIADIALGMKSEDYLDLPERIDNYLTIPLPPKARAQYAQLERELFLELEGGDVEAANAAVKSAKCEQAANGALYLDRTDRWQTIHDAKLDAMREIVDNGEPVLCVTLFRSDWERIKAAFPFARRLDEGPAAERDWNARKVQLLVAHASQGEGLNLQSGGRVIVWFAPTWNLLHYEQMNARLHRQGQRDEVIVHHLVAQGTVDEIKRQRLETKASVQELMLSAMRGSRLARAA